MINRYKLSGYPNESNFHIPMSELSPDGEWVLYEDIRNMEKRIDELEVALRLIHANNLLPIDPLRQVIDAWFHKLLDSEKEKE